MILLAYKDAERIQQILNDLSVNSHLSIMNLRGIKDIQAILALAVDDEVSPGTSLGPLTDALVDKVATEVMKRLENIAMGGGISSAAAQDSDRVDGSAVDHFIHRSDAPTASGQIYKNGEGWVAPPLTVVYPADQFFALLDAAKLLTDHIERLRPQLIASGDDRLLERSASLEAAIESMVPGTIKR